MLPVIVIVLLTCAAPAAALGSSESERPAIAHPEIHLLDLDGNDVILSGKAVSSMRTCGRCHDAEFISNHSYHASVGFDEMFDPGSFPSRRPWDISPGLFGRWDPLVYRYLTPTAGDLPDLGTPGWILALGHRHTGGGPAVLSRSGTPLTEIDPDAKNPEACVLDDGIGTAVEWDWRESGVVEFNCFICHLASPDNDARTEALRSGLFGWAATATLGRTGLVEREGSGWKWIREAFDEGGLPEPERVRIVPPSSSHCGQCHGLVHFGEEPLIPRYGEDLSPSTEIKGQIFSAQLLSRSGMNLEGKDELATPWDVHAERLLECSDCHFSLNDPAFATKEAGTERGLSFDGRRLGIDEFLTTPDHNFAKGWAAQGTVADDLDGTMRRCENCHDTQSSHDWLPYKGRHMDRLMCEACHIPKVRAPARRATDWTVLTKAGDPRIEYRGVRGDVGDPAAIIDGFRPILLPRDVPNGEPTRLAPHNLIATYFWIHGDPPRPVRLHDLKRAYLEGGSYHPEVVAALDDDGDGDVDLTELLLDTPRKVAAIAVRLEALGLDRPRVSGEIQPYSLHHGVVTGKWATRDCSRCHSRPSDVARPFVIASAAPGGIVPRPVGDTNALLEGGILTDRGRVLYVPVTMEGGFYILGHDRWRSIDLAGAVVVIGALVGVLLHGGIRVLLSRRRRSRS